jgi:hypothetical protein
VTYLPSRGLRRVLQIKAVLLHHSRLGHIASVRVFRLAFTWRHLMKTPLHYSAHHGHTASSNSSRTGTEAQAHTAPSGACLLLHRLRLPVLKNLAPILNGKSAHSKPHGTLLWEFFVHAAKTTAPPPPNYSANLHSSWNFQVYSTICRRNLILDYPTVQQVGTLN